MVWPDLLIGMSVQDREGRNLGVVDAPSQERLGLPVDESGYRRFRLFFDRRRRSLLRTL